MFLSSTIITAILQHDFFLPQLLLYTIFFNFWEKLNPDSKSFKKQTNKQQNTEWIYIIVRDS